MRNVVSTTPARRRRVALAVVVAAMAPMAACGGEEKPNAPAMQATYDAGVKLQGPTTDMGTIYERAVTLMEQLAEVADANQASCAVMAREIDSLLLGSEPLLKQAKAMKKASKQDVGTQERFQPRMMAAMAKLMPAMEKCKDHPALQSAMQRLD